MAPAGNQKKGIIKRILAKKNPIGILLINDAKNM
jgi:hypothetical protein